MADGLLKRAWRVAYRVYHGLSDHDGWAIASHIALSALLALFPFLIFLTALASFLGTAEFADAVVDVLIEAIPERVAQPIAVEVRNVLTGQRRDLMTIGGALAVWFSSSGVESLRIGLNRAYGVPETRYWFETRLRSIFFVLIGAIGLLALGFFVVLAPAAIATTTAFFPELETLIRRYDLVRYVATSAILFVGLYVVHLFLPAGRRDLAMVTPGILLTLAAWLAAAILFGYYLARFSTYASTYAGFAGAMIALVFLYFLALIFLIGGELNAAIAEERRVDTLT